MQVVSMHEFTPAEPLIEGWALLPQHLLSGPSATYAEIRSAVGAVEPMPTLLSVLALGRVPEGPVAAVRARVHIATGVARPEQRERWEWVTWSPIDVDTMSRRVASSLLMRSGADVPDAVAAWLQHRPGDDGDGKLRGRAIELARYPHARWPGADNDVLCAWLATLASLEEGGVRAVHRQLAAAHHMHPAYVQAIERAVNAYVGSLARKPETRVH